jgi:diaminohydroxyphosphoribosylaminopyrimidine deaminase/5-amino-6-(5-phosphoribosylamino)uracil reductase
MFMRRCFDLARRGKGLVSPNPLVGSVLVFDERVIGEGFHTQYGGNHAERQAIGGVADADKAFISRSRLYVSLEPCCHQGKTPPCTNLILSSGIKEVYLSTQDPNPLVSGKGIQVLRDHGVKVYENILQDEGLDLIRFFRTAMTQQRPHVILKIVQSADGFIGKPDTQVWLSNAYERVMVHKLRSEIDAIMVGTNTAVIDNPELTTRFYAGRNPVRVVIDRTGRIPRKHHLFDGCAPTLLYTEQQPYNGMPDNLETVIFKFDDALPEKILEDLHTRRIQSLLVEGGAQLISSFISKGLWDEALVVRTPKILQTGVQAPLIEGRLKWRYQMAGDEILAIVP